MPGDVSAIRAAIELLSKAGFTIWKDGARLVTDADRRREAERRQQEADFQRLLDEHNNRGHRQ